MSLFPDAWFYYNVSYIPNESPFQRPMVGSDLAEKNLRDPECFAVMLLLDGCFILELFFKWLDEKPDFLFKERLGQRHILPELLLLSNQIPFMVIERLYELVMVGPGAILPTQVRHKFLSLLAKFLVNEEPMSHTFEVTAWPEKIHHLLDFYHQFLIATTSLCQDEYQNHYLTTFPLWKHQLISLSTPSLDQLGADRPPRHIPCATKLHEVGIKFRKKQSPKNLLDVTCSRGILEIPFLEFDDNKKILFFNLVGIEQEKAWMEQIVTSYIVLMNSLINTKEDVELLQSAGVIHNKLSTHQEAALFFNELDRSLLFDTANHHFAKLFRNVKKYYNSNWERLIREYFNSVWATLSIVYGVILLVLTVLQTFYTVYPYYGRH